MGHSTHVGSLPPSQPPPFPNKDGSSHITGSPGDEVGPQVELMCHCATLLAAESLVTVTDAASHTEDTRANKPATQLLSCEAVGPQWAGVRSTSHSEKTAALLSPVQCSLETRV